MVDADTCTLPPAREEALVGQVMLYAPARPQPGHAVETRHKARTAGVAVAMPAAVSRDLLTMLHRAKALSKVVVIRFDALPTLCVVPGIDMVYSLAPLQALFDAPTAELAPSFLTVARNSHHGRTEAQAYRSRATKGHYVTMLDTPLRNLMWVATLRCGTAEEGKRYTDAAYVLQGWPDFSTLPHLPHHMKWCGLLARRPMTATALAAATGHATTSAAVFLAALDELGVLHQKAPQLEAAPARLALGGPSAHAGGMFGRFRMGRA